MEQKKKNMKLSFIIMLITLIFLTLAITLTFAYYSDFKLFFKNYNSGDIQIDTTSGEATKTKIDYTVTRNGVANQKPSVLMPGDTISINFRLKLTSTSEPAYYLVQIRDSGDLAEVFNTDEYSYLDEYNNVVQVSDSSLTKSCGLIEPSETIEFNVDYLVPLSFEIKNAHASLTCTVYAMQRANVTQSKAYYLIDEMIQPSATLTTSALAPYKGSESTTTELGFYKPSNMPSGYTLDAEKTAALQETLSASSRDIIKIYTNGTKVAFVSKGIMYAPTNCYQLFKDSITLTNIDFQNFDTRNVTNMGWMFMGCTNLISLDLKRFNTVSCTDLSRLCQDCTKLENIDVSSFNTHNVTTINAMFWKCKITYLDLSNFDTSNVTIMNQVFRECSNLEYVNVSSFDTSKVTTMAYMFGGCTKLAYIDVSGFDTKNVVSFECMFRSCQTLETINVSNFDTTNATNMKEMFCGTINVKSIDVSNFDTSKVTDMSAMFNSMKSIKSLDLSNFDARKVTNILIF